MSNPNSTGPTGAQPSEGGVYLVLDLAGMEARALAQGLGRSVAEAAMMMRRDRFTLYRSKPQDPAAIGGLERCGLKVVPLDASAVAQATLPTPVRGGDPAAGLFLLVGADEPRRVAPGDVIVHVWGAVRREHLSAENEPRSRHRPDGGLRSYRAHSEGLLIHLHTQGEIHPLEIDADAFEFPGADGKLTSSLLRLRRGLAVLAEQAVEDRSFRFETPALGRAQPVGSGRLSALSGLLRGATAADGGRQAEWLDNVAQFRFHSAWRGVLARQMRG